MKWKLESFVKPSLLASLAVCAAIVFTGQAALFAKDAPPGAAGRGTAPAKDDKAPDAKTPDTGLKKGGETGLDDQDNESHPNLDRTRQEEIETDPGRKEYVSIRRKRSIFAFHMGFSIGAMGYGILGPRLTDTYLYKFKYQKYSFTAGVRVGIEPLFYLKKVHCLSLGAFFEQRKVQIKIARISLSGLFVNYPYALLYLQPLTYFVDKSNVDTNYIAIPVSYRYHVTDEFYIGAGLDIAVLFYAKANYGVTIYSTSTRLEKRLQPVDFSGRIIFGFTMNRVFIEISTGAGLLDYDRLKGERHSINLTGMIGYKI
jgi:hypothetical protein